MIKFDEWKKLDIRIGEIKEVKKSDVTPYQKADLQPFFYPSNLETVFIITSF